MKRKMVENDVEKKCEKGTGDRISRGKTESCRRLKVGASVKTGRR